MSPIPEALLNLLKLLLLVLVYLFFWRVLRAVWAEVNGPKAVRSAPAAVKRPRRSKKHQPGGPEALVVVEPEEQRGRRFGVGEEITIGRAAGCQISLEDAYVSQIHARVFTADGKVMVEDLGSTNGTLINRKRLTRQTVLNPGDRLQVGSTVMELA